MNTPSIDFMAARRTAGLASIVLVLASIALLFVNGLSFGLDFTGGSLVELEFASEPNLQRIREVLMAAGFPDAVVQAFGAPTDVVVRLAQDNAPRQVMRYSQPLNRLDTVLNSCVLNLSARQWVKNSANKVDWAYCSHSAL